VLHHPHVPNIPGLDSFGGDVLHSARWDDSVTTAGKRVAVIGSGSTGVQLVSSLQPEAAHIAHFVRTPQWVIWAPTHLRQSSAVSRLLGNFPWLNRRLHNATLMATDFLTDILI
jgi:cation diffusion facilitator CzcD-associated flavoprotein CzcO